MPRSKPREFFVDDQTLLPEMSSLGTDAPHAADHRGLHAHIHAGAWEICYIARGSVEWWAGEEIYEVGPGMLYLTRPDEEEHGGVDAVLHPCELYWLTVRLPRTGDLPGLERCHGRELARRFHAMRFRCFPGSESIRDTFERLLDQHRQRDALGPIAARAALHELLVTVLRDYDTHADQHRAHDRGLSPAIRAAMDWMRQHLAEDVTVEDVAAQVGLSPTRFHERFREEVGFSPADWRQRQRIRLAKQLLRRPERTVTDVALVTGFSTSQYFATAFKRLVGLTPREYRQRLR